jgi:hypothetical protein
MTVSAPTMRRTPACDHEFATSYGRSRQGTIDGDEGESHRVPPRAARTDPGSVFRVLANEDFFCGIALSARRRANRLRLHFGDQISMDL